MALRYSRLGSTLKVVNKGEKALTAATTDELAVIDLTAAPYAHGIRSVLFTLQNMALSGGLSLTCSGNTAANGSGTDTVLATMSIDVSDTVAAMEIDSELIGHFSDRATGGTFKSLVFDGGGTDTDTVDQCYVVDCLQEQDLLTPSDTTTVT